MLSAKWSLFILGLNVFRRYFVIIFFMLVLPCTLKHELFNEDKSISTFYCPACRTYEIATRFWEVVIGPIYMCLTVYEFYFVWFEFIHYNLQFYFELYTYCNILDIYLL